MHARHSLIATLPKSGTWYAQIFLWCYGEFLRHPERGTPDLASALRDPKHKMVMPPSVFGRETLYVGHAICPGFESSDDSLRDPWEKLRFPMPYNHIGETLQARGEWSAFDPARNPESRIVYLFRNPLDHFVSCYSHAQTHKKDDYRFRILPNGERVPIQDVREFVFGFGILGAFIKQFYSFAQMRKRFPQQILLIPYEKLTASPQEAFSRILDFLGQPVTPDRKDRFEQAVTMCAKENLSAIEARLGRSLAGDQVGSQKHIRDGAVGKWREHFTIHDLALIEAAFQEFGLSLSQFDLGDAPFATTLPSVSPQALQNALYPVQGKAPPSINKPLISLRNAWKRLRENRLEPS